MDLTEIDPDELDRLRIIEAEYSVTVKVLAVVVELFMAAAAGDSIEITDSAVHDAPELQAWRVKDHGSVVITVNRP